MNRSLLHISAILPKVLARKSLAGSAQKAELLFFAQKVLHQVLQTDSPLLRPTRLHYGTLYVNVPSAAFAQKIQLNLVLILQKLEKKFPKKVKKIRTRVQNKF